VRILTLRTTIFAYLAAVHLALAVLCYYALRGLGPLYLLAAEALLLLSLAVAYRLLRAFLVPLELIGTGAELLAERDFSSQFREVGQPEMDKLVRVYNEMSRELREERVRAQEQHHFLERVLQATPAGILCLDFDGKVSSANPAACALLGLADGEAVGRELASLPGPGSLAAELAALPLGASRVIASGRRRLKVSRAELFDRGFPRHFLAIEELTEELRASEKAAYGKLIRMTSHEVNNSVGPVASLLDSFRGYGEQLGEEDRQDFAAALAVAIARLERLSAFVGGFAEMVRLPPPERRPCDLERLVDEILTLLRPQLLQRGIEVTWARAERVGEIAFDRNQLEQVLVNVFKNAMEAIGEQGGRIELRLERVAGRPRLEIADSGPGIAEEVLPLLFAPFFSTKRDGRGLGLTLLREILAQHGFDFGLENRPEGGGAAFWISF
jgi:two-component system, NtrC family, nitrogen regulation sensor histidine kinase NtrY